MICILLHKKWHAENERTKIAHTTRKESRSLDFRSQTQQFLATLTQDLVKKIFTHLNEKRNYYRYLIILFNFPKYLLCINTFCFCLCFLPLIDWLYLVNL